MATEKKKVGYVLKVFPRLSQTFVVNELVAHEMAGWEIVVFSLKRPRPDDITLAESGLKSPVVYLKGPPENWSDELAQLAEHHEIEHLHAHFGNVAAETARLAARKSGIPYTFTAHALDIFDDKVDRSTLQRKILDSACVVTVSRFNARYLRENFGRRPVVVYNGLPINMTERFPAVFPAERELTNGQGSDPIILAVGRLIEKKGFDVLIDACSELVARGLSFRCRIIGSGPLEDDLQQQIERQKLQNRVELVARQAPGRKE